MKPFAGQRSYHPTPFPMNSLNRLRGMLAAVLALVAANLAVAQSANQPPAGSETLKLPDFKVTDSPDLPKPESWNYAKVGSFEVLSNASERTTRSLVADFGMFTRAMALSASGTGTNESDVEAGTHGASPRLALARAA